MNNSEIYSNKIWFHCNIDNYIKNVIDTILRLFINYIFSQTINFRVKTILSKTKFKVIPKDSRFELL